MKCEYTYCVYNEGLLCTLKKIQINSWGMCNDCIVVSIADDVLKYIKEKHLADLEKGGKGFRD